MGTSEGLTLFLNLPHTEPSIFHFFPQGVPCPRYALRLEKIEFDNGRLQKNWLKLPAGLNTLEIFDSDLELIEEDVFQDRTYRDVVTLRFNRLQLKQLQANTFSGLTKLEYLGLVKLPLESVAAGVLSPLERTLRTFAFLYNPLPLDPINFTEDANLSTLESMIMPNNNFGSFINGKTFKNLPRLINLTLSESNIERLTTDTFKSIATIRTLRLDGNKLQSLPQNIFSRIKSPQFRVILERNPWNCDCDLLELREQMRSKMEWFNDRPTCLTPDYLEGQPVRDADFCQPTVSEMPLTEVQTTEDTTVVTTTVVTTTTETNNCNNETTAVTAQDDTYPTTETTDWYTTGATSTVPETTDTTMIPTYTTYFPPFITSTPRYVPSTEAPPNCSTINQESICGQNNVWLTQCQLSTLTRVNQPPVTNPTKVQIQAPTFTFKIKEIERFKVEIRVKCKGFAWYDQYFILWFADESMERGLISNDKLLADCHCAEQEDVFVQHLEPSTAYTFCVMVSLGSAGNIRDSMVTSPFDCLAYKTKPLKSEDTWLKNEDRWQAMCIMLIILVLCSVFGALTMYFIVRRMPTLLRGSERVVIVNNNQVKVYASKSLKKSDSIVSSNISTIQSRPLPDIQQSTYLTPIPKKSSIYK